MCTNFSKITLLFYPSTLNDPLPKRVYEARINNDSRLVLWTSGSRHSTTDPTASDPNTQEQVELTSQPACVTFPSIVNGRACSNSC